MTTEVEKFISYENGTMSDEEVIIFFQELVDSGIVWKLQGSYGRMAESLIEQGMVKETSTSRLCDSYTLHKKIKKLDNE